MSDTEELLSNELDKYVSNTNRDIYTVSNIPEEVIAVIFAYVSRSPKSFRDNIGVVIEEEQFGQERASKFHEKWVLNYGHASVAEHAVVHIGIENVSRLFSSALELSNEFLSFTEYAQWDIKNVTTILVEKISGFHPNLVKPGIERLNL